MDIRDHDPVLQCPCEHLWWEKIDLPMEVGAFVDRVNGMLRCPKCGKKDRRNAKSGAIMMLTGQVRNEAIAKLLSAARS